ncbi:LAFE_0G05820g1_1 [Lachancea fermentati]|uniref:LAFE_0G05820g1_1 n=1 Tax=Lachancea fermentati TaxID=4955 RepID=A0A1G4MH90_LACFM|nr:LAFE_0G05820g1_1 [Lachancea fermentati]
MNRIAIGQLCSSSSHDHNLERVRYLTEQALKQDVRLVFFPEATDYISRSAAHSKVLAQKTPVFVEQLKKTIVELCSRYGKPIDVSIGVHLPPDELDVSKKDDRVKNCNLYINHEGKIIQSYQKLHLFDVDVPNGPITRESDSVQPGNELPAIVNTPVGKLGTAICFDVRFPEMSLKLRSNGAEILCFPSAFTMKTGEAHWQILGQARALDTQCFVVMPGQQGEHDVYADTTEEPPQNSVKRSSWGHSMIIDPWGSVIIKADPTSNEPQLIVADLDKSLQEKTRTNMPLWKQRRRDIFGSYV